MNHISFLKEHIWPNYRYCFVDPDIRNEASTRLFQKRGFIEHKQIDSQNALKQPVALKFLMKKREKFSVPSEVARYTLYGDRIPLSSYNITSNLRCKNGALAGIEHH